MEDQLETIKKQASRQGGEVSRIIDEMEKKDHKIVDLQATIDEMEKKVKNADAALKQSKSQQEEYMRLADRYNELEKKTKGYNESNKDK